MNNIALSIIIPHYNTPNLLMRLIQSIPYQSNWQILIIDDNSTVDLTPLLDFLNNQTLYDIELLYNTSGSKGAGSCRNIGLNKALGLWTIFADADDYFTPAFFKELEPFLSSDYDEVFFTPTSIDEKTGKLSSRHFAYSEMIKNYIEKPSLKTLSEMKYGFCTPWSKLIRTSIIKDNNIKFDQIMVSNDIMFMTKCALYSKKITATKGIIYCVTRNQKTLTSNKNDALFDIRIQVLINRYTFLQEHLSSKEFYYTYIDRIALARLVDIILERYGSKKLIQVLKLYHKNGIKFFDIALLNPCTLVKKAKIELQWWIDIKKSRKG